MSAPFILPITQFVDHSGPLSGWSVAFTDGQTNLPLTAFKSPALDPLAAWGTSVAADSFGRLPPLWLTPTGRSYRATITWPNGTTRTIDGLVLASPDAVASASAFAAPSFSVTSRTGTSVSIAPADFGSVIDIPSSSAAVIAQLPDISTVTAGRIIGITSDGPGGVVALPIAGQGSAIAITGSGSTTLILATGAGYRVIAQTAPTPSYYVAQTRQQTTPPPAAAVGLSYLMPSTAATGFLVDAIYTSRGDGTFTVHRPSTGDECVVLDELETGTNAAGVSTSAPRTLIYSGTQWVNRFDIIKDLIASAVSASSTSTLASVAVIRDEYVSGTASLTAHGSTPSSGVETRANLNTIDFSNIAGLTLAGNQIMLPKGKFLIRAKRKVTGSFTGAVAKFVSTNVAVAALTGNPIVTDGGTVGDDEWLEVRGVVTSPAAGTPFELHFIIAGFTSATILGLAASLPGVNEVYGMVEITTISLG